MQQNATDPPGFAGFTPLISSYPCNKGTKWYKAGPALITQQQVGERTCHLVEGWYDLLGIRILHLEEDHLIARLWI